MRELLRARRPWLEATGWALAAIGAASFLHALWQSFLGDGGAAYDLHAYLHAGRHLLEGVPLYGPMEINDPGAFRYPPLFALLAVPLALLPEEPVTWAYRAVGLRLVRYLVGSWRATGVALLFPQLQIELIALNVTLPLAAAARMSLRGPAPRVGTALLPFTATLKVGSALLVPYLWVTRRHRRGAVVAGIGAVGAAAAVHALLDPGSWRDYVASLGQQAGSANDAPYVGDQLLFLVPSTLGDFLLRLALAVALTGLALWRRWDWLAFVAAAIAVPTLWVARLAPLVAVPRLVLEDWRLSREGSAAVAPRATRT